ncbi:hypothetical protein [Clavibacter michiganensis]|uniref:hypothetical protein n=1 Tax=Clavibacter michiganensis TaxID=28447 RepID=UPI0010553C1F|nr:hypothetical protein [Clavibacter michiganensis]
MNRQAYLRELTYELRSRKNDDSAIRVVLRELPAELSGEELEREFGSAHDYAASFPKGTTRSTGWWCITVAVAVAALLLASRPISVFVLRQDSSLALSLGTLAIGIALIIAASIAAGQVDRRVPRGVE